MIVVVVVIMVVIIVALSGKIANREQDAYQQRYAQAPSAKRGKVKAVILIHF